MVPTFSLDSGLVFERDASYFGRSFRQTLEPRAFYVYTPFRDQNYLPNYDSAANDFNFATIYTENAFGGNDRISDSNLLTLGVSTRLLDPRHRRRSRPLRRGPAVALQGPAGHVARRRAGQRAAVGHPVRRHRSTGCRKWSIDSTVQYNPKTERSIRSTHRRRATAPATTT